MKGKPFEFRGQNVVVLNYCLDAGEDADEVEIYLNNGQTLVYNYGNILSKLDKFHPIDNTVIVLANKKLNQCSTINPGVLDELRESVMESIRAVRQDPKNIKQAQQVFQGVNTMANLAKTELELRKFINQQNQ